MAGEPPDSPAIRIRRATAADAQAVLALVPRLVAFGPPPWRDAESMTRTDLKVVRRALRSNSDDPIVLVAEGEAGEVAGFIHLHSVVDYYTERRNGHVADIVVATAFEGRGVGRRLLAEAETWARAQGYELLTIAAFTANSRAAEVYRKAGFADEVVRLIKPLR